MFLQILQMNFNVLFALEVAELTCGFQSKSLEMLMPKYFAAEVDFSSVPCNL